MQLTDFPARFAKAFAEAAGAGYVRAIPDASQIGIVDGAASFPDGFVPLNATPVSAGGVPPDIKDMNGILFRLSQWAKWVSAGGPVPFNATYATAIGGYPLGACVRSNANVNVFWLSTIDNNSHDPDTDGTGWAQLVPIKASAAAIATGLDDAQYITALGLAAQRGTLAELVTGTAADKLVTALRLAGLRATFAQVQAGTDPARYITPAVLAALRADGAAVKAGTSDSLYVTPLSLADCFGSGTDHIYLPGGLLFQWGMNRVFLGDEGAVLQTFPIAYTTAVYSIVAVSFTTPPNNFNDDMWGKISTNTLTDFYFNYGAPGNGNVGRGFNWLAIGR